MPKTSTTALTLPSDTTDGKTADVWRFELSPEFQALALDLGVDLSGSRTERANRAAGHMNSSQRQMLSAGLLLASLKAECAHGEFTALVAEHGFEVRAARTAMQYTAFVLSRPQAERERLVNLPKYKVLEIAGADPEVIDQILTDPEKPIDGLSVRALRDRIRELEARSNDLAVQRDTAEAEAEGLRKQIKRGLPERADQVPLQVADARAEISALHKKASLALDSFQALGVDLVGMPGQGVDAEWVDATLRLAASSLTALQVQVQAVCQRYVQALDGEPAPVPRSYLTQQEVAEAARLHQELTRTHEYERMHREWLRAQARPRSKGRPTAEPKPPKGAAA